MTENQIAKTIVNACIKIHKALGPGLFESVYENILKTELSREGLRVEAQKAIPVFWEGERLEQGFRADLVIENKVIIEVKSVEYILKVHQKQLLTYLRLTNMKLGLLINFNEALLKDGLQRIVNNL